MEDYSKYDLIVVGAGFYGATVANKIAERGKKVLVLDRRNHVAGNAYSYRDEKTGIEIHRYGSHIFHTEDEEVWEYITKFTEFNNYIHTVPTRHNGKLYPMPINLDTINLLYGTDMGPEEAEKFVAEEAKKAGITNPKNFEEKGISLVGEKLYTTFIKNYSEKQWSTSAENLSADILSRIPVRYSTDDRYFMTAKHQGIPVNGYGKIVEKMLDNLNIEVRLSTDFIAIMDEIPAEIPVVYCGQVDELLDYELGVLPYRSLRFEAEWVDENTEDGADSRLGHAVINEADSDVAYTRTHFYKYYQIHEPEVIAQPKSYAVREYPADFVRGGEAYYPINNAENENLYSQYVELLADRYPNITLGGRLGAYQYWDMDKAIRNALDFVETLGV
ncbi:MAG: UDP-galactopyranose mutase [Candidatus Saccharibacteria bacterium]|nr:UDP-galactopyranose mutase [Candidatus Saccharibacteria bacterium]